MYQDSILCTTTVDIRKNTIHQRIPHANIAREPNLAAVEASTTHREFSIRIQIVMCAIFRVADGPPVRKESVIENRLRVQIPQADRMCA